MFPFWNMLQLINICYHSETCYMLQLIDIYVTTLKHVTTLKDVSPFYYGTITGMFLKDDELYTDTWVLSKLCFKKISKRGWFTLVLLKVTLTD